LGEEKFAGAWNLLSVGKVFGVCMVDIKQRIEGYQHFIIFVVSSWSDLVIFGDISLPMIV
jgi:hypothetical protein